jgi:hypothetical protein
MIHELILESFSGDGFIDPHSHIYFRYSFILVHPQTGETKLHDFFSKYDAADVEYVQQNNIAFAENQYFTIPHLPPLIFFVLYFLPFFVTFQATVNETGASLRFQAKQQIPWPESASKLHRVQILFLKRYDMVYFT